MRRSGSMVGTGRVRRGAGAAALLLLAAAGCSDGAGPGDKPARSCLTESVPYPDKLGQTGDVQHVHDPEIARHGNAYYVYSTNDGIPIRRSRDLVSWEMVGRVFDAQLPPWAKSEVPGVEAPWAPDVAFFNGRYHLYYSLSTFGSQRSVIGLATSPTLDPADPAYRWEDRGKVLQSFPGVSRYNAIDPNVVLDADGAPWLSWGSYWGGIYLRRLDPATGLLSASDATEHHLAGRSGGSTAVEAPYIVRRGEYYYLFVSFDVCCRGAESTYNVRVGRSSAVTGPYVDRAGIPMTQGGGTVVLEGYGRFRGPGHNSVLEDGGRMYLAHHFYDAQASGVPRLQIRPLVWDADGWPLAGSPYTGPSAPAAAGVQGSWGMWTGAGSPTRVELQAGGRFERCNGEGSWQFDAPWLRTTWTPTGATGQTNAETSWVSSGGDWLVGRSADGQLVRGYRLPDR